MTREDIVEKVNALLAEEFEVDIDVIQPDAPLMETLELDSLDLVDMVVLVEKNFAIIQQTYKVKIPVADLREIKTFDNLYDYIESHAKQE